MARVNLHPLVSFNQADKTQAATFVYKMRGYHVDMKDWKPTINQRLFTIPERDNTYDSNCAALVTRKPDAEDIAVADRDKYGVVGHIPIEMSRAAHAFLRRGGVTTARLVGEKFKRSNKAEGSFSRKLSTSK